MIYDYRQLNKKFRYLDKENTEILILNEFLTKHEITDEDIEKLVKIKKFIDVPIKDFEFYIMDGEIRNDGEVDEIIRIKLEDGQAEHVH
jgi:hypothetical protein